MHGSSSAWTSARFLVLYLSFPVFFSTLARWLTFSFLFEQVSTTVIVDELIPCTRTALSFEIPDHKSGKVSMTWPHRDYLMLRYFRSQEIS